jgi:hypothetical protein
MKDACLVIDAATGGGRIHVAPEVDAEWAREVWDAHVRSGRERLVIVDLPGERRDGSSAPAPTGTAFVKVYRPRAKHGLLRRLRPGRAAREGRGYEAFARAGLPAVRLLFWGEERRWALLRVGAVATLQVAAEPVSVAYGSAPREDLLQRTAAALGAIHRAGLAHGDPRTRNFLATMPVPLAIDLPSWSTLSRRSQTQDLVRFLGSALVLSGGIEGADKLLEVYGTEGLPLPVPSEELLGLADRYRLKEGIP